MKQAGTYDGRLQHPAAMTILASEQINKFILTNAFRLCKEQKVVNRFPFNLPYYVCRNYRKKKLHVRTLIVHLEGETLFFESHRL